MNLLLIFILIVLNEAIMEFFVGNVPSLRRYIPLLSLAVAIFLTFIYRINLFQIFLGIGINPVLDSLFSAFVIARLSNYLNDLVDKFSR